MDPIRFFDSLDLLEPHCPKCETTIHYGRNTEYDEELEKHRCAVCKTVLE